MALKVGELYASFGIDSSGLDRALSGIEKKCSSIAKSFAIAGAAMTATLTRSIVNTGKEIYQTGTEFHAQMSKVGAIANADTKELEVLTQKALEMGSTTSFTASEAGEAMEYMAMAGWKAEDMLDGIGAIMDLAAASGESLGTTSDIVTDALTAMGYSAKDAEHFANVMAAASTNANTNVSMMGESFKYVAPLAGTLGYSIDDLAVAMGVMANSGIKSSQAGTSLARILNNMIKPTEDQEAAMKELGLSLYDNEGNTKSLMQVMEDMRAAAKENGVDMAALADDIAKLDAQLESGEISERQYMDQMTALTGVSQDFMSSVAELAGTRGLSGMLAIMNASDADFYKLVEAIENCDGALDEMVAKMLDNAQGDMILFESAVDGLKITLWDLVEGPVRNIIQASTGFVQAFQAMGAGTQTTVLKIAGLAAAAGPALTAMGGLVGFAGKLAPFLTALAGPVGIVGAGLGLFAVAAVDADNSIGKMFKTVARKGSVAMHKLNKRINSSMETVSSRMPALIGTITDGLGVLVPEAMDISSSIVNGFLKTITVNAPKLAGIGKTVIQGVATGISKNAPTVLPNAVNTITGVVTSIISNVPSFLHSAIDIGKGLLEGLKNVNWAEAGLSLLRSVISAAQGIGTELLNLFESAKTTLLNMSWAEIGEKISGAFTEAGKIIKEAVLGEKYTDDSTWSDVGAQLWETLKSGFTAVADFTKLLVLGENYTADASWSTVGTAIWSTIKKGIGKATDLLAELVLGDDYKPDDSFETVCSKIWVKIKDGAKDGIKSAAELLAGLILGEDYKVDDSFGSVCGKIWNKITDGVKDGIKSGAELLVGLVLGEDYSPDDSFGTVCGKIWKKITDGIATGIKTGGELLSGLILGKDYSPDDSFGKVCEMIWDKIKGGVETGFGNAKDLLGTLTLGDDYTADTSWSSVAGAIWEKIKGGVETGFGNAKELLGTLVLGDDYTPDASWEQVGQGIWNTIKDNMGDIGEWLRVKFALAKASVMSVDWSEVGTGIWNKIQAALAFITAWFRIKFEAAKNAVANVSWSEIGSNIWNKIQAALASISAWFRIKFEAAKNAVTGVNWGEIGTNISKNIHTALTNLGSWIRTKFETARDIAAAIDWSNVWSNILTFTSDLKDGAYRIAENIIDWVEEKLNTLGQEGSEFKFGDMSGIMDNLIDSIVNSKSDNTEKIGGLIDKIMQGMVDFDWSGIGMLGSNVASKLIESIAGGFHRLTGPAGEIIDTLGDVLGGKNGVSFIDSATSIAKSIVTAISEALPGIVDDSTSIVTNLGELLGKLPWSNMGADLGDLATTIVDKATSALNAISSQGGFSTMIDAIGSGMVAAVDGITSAIGTFVGKIAGFLTNPDNLSQLAETGAKFAWEVIKGFFTMSYRGIDALGTGLGNLIVGISRGLFGVEVDPEVEKKIHEFEEKVFGDVQGAVLFEQMETAMGSADNLRAAMAAWGVVIEEGLENCLPQFRYLGNEVMTNLAMSMLEHGDTIENGVEKLAFMFASGYFENLETELGQGTGPDILQGLYDEAYALIDRSNDSFFDLSSVIADAGIDMGEMFGASLPEGFRLGIRNGKMAIMEEATGNILDEAFELIEDEFDMSRLSDFLSESWKTAMTASFGSISDQNVFNAFKQAFSNLGFSASDVMNMDLSGINTTDIIAYAEEYGMTLEEALMDVITGVNQSIKDTPIEMPEGAGVDQTTLDGITAQSEQTSNTIAEAFNTLPQDIQVEVAEAMTALITTISDNQGEVTIACQAVVAAADSAMSQSEGENIGFNFTAGLAIGIDRGRNQVVHAINRVANAVTDSITKAWEIGSPSKLANRLGRFYDIGLAYGLYDKEPMVKKAVKSVMDTVSPDTYVKDLTKATKAVSSAGGSSGSSSGRSSGGSSGGSSGSDYSDITSRLDTIISNQGQDMRLVTDDGAFVGSLIREIDSQLGDRTEWRGGGRA